MQLTVFSKHLAGLSLDEAAQKLRAMNISALDLTVRPNGHVEPARVADELPQIAAELKSRGISIGQITTEITDADAPHARAILEGAAQLGIGFYKVGYYPYEGFGTLRKARDEARARIAGLAQLSAEIGIVGGYHNHSRNFIGAALGDVAHILGDQNQIGFYFDPAHAHIEGGASGWEMGLDVLSERVVMLAVKDYAWIEGGAYGGRRFGAQWSALAEGNSPWESVLSRLKTIGFDGPISLHAEYKGLEAPQFFAQMARDAQWFRAQCAQIGWDL